MHHWLGDKMSLKAEKQIKVSGMRVEKCGEVGRLEERCGEGYSSHLELASITLISLSLSRVHIFSLSLTRFFFLWPAVTGGFSFHFRGAHCISQSWREPLCVCVCFWENTFTGHFGDTGPVPSPSPCPLVHVLRRSLLSSVSRSPPGPHEFNWGQDIHPWKVRGTGLGLHKYHN